MSNRTPRTPIPRWQLTPTKIIVAGLLLIGIIVPLLVSTYDQIEPRLFGFPFFYWYQLAWVFIAAGICWLSFVLLQAGAGGLPRAPCRAAGGVAS